MRWTFWRRDRAPAPARPLPTEVGLRWRDEPAPSPPRSVRPPDDDGWDDRWGVDRRGSSRWAAGRTGRAPRGSPPVPAPAVTSPAVTSPDGPAPGRGPGDPATGPGGVEHVLDGAVLALVRDATVDLVRALLQADPAVVHTAFAPLAARLATATLDQQALAVVVSLAVLSERLPPLAGATGTVDDPEQRALLLAYADLLVARAEPLRRRAAPEVEPGALRYAAHFACGAPDADPALGRRAEAPAADQVLAACVLLAQTCLDGGAGPEALVAELDAVLPAE